MKNLKVHFILVAIFSLLSSATWASNVTFKCKAIGENGQTGPIVYEYDPATGNFAKDFTVIRDNITGTKTHMAKWRLNKDQCIKIIGKDTVEAITQVELLCETVDPQVKTSVGDILFIGNDVIRILIPYEDKISDLIIYKDKGAQDDSPQLRVQQISINYVVENEEYVPPKPLVPTFAPIGGTYYRPWNIELKTQEPRSTIRYTTDGSAPTKESPLFTGQIYVDKDTRINAITINEKGVVSEMSTAMYRIRELKLPLAADSSYLIDFPQLEKTAHETPAIAQISLPKNFDPNKKHPLFVWFSPGSGGYATKRPVDMIDNTDFIVVGLPYRSWHLGGGWQTPWAYHKTMLDSIEKLLPNIDPDNRIAGGWSSGGAQICHHIATSNGAFQDYFYGFLPGGAGFDIGGLPTIKYRPMLITIGAEDKRTFPLGDLYWKAALAGVDVTFNEMEGVGHVLPDSVYPYMRDWIYDKVINRNEEKSNVFLKEIKIAGQTLNHFDPKVHAYQIDMPKPITTMPEVIAVPQDDSASVSYDNSKAQYNLKYIHVTAKDGRTKRYTVYFKYKAPVTTSGLLLNDLKVNGVSIYNFNPETYYYAFELSTKDIPEVVATSDNADVTISIQQATAVPGTAIISLTGKDGATEEYGIVFSVKEEEEPPVVSDHANAKIRKTSNPIVIDGNFNDETWTKITEIQQDSIVTDGLTDPSSTFYWRACWDEQNLYVALRVIDPKIVRDSPGIINGSFDDSFDFPIGFGNLESDDNSEINLILIIVEPEANIPTTSGVKGGGWADLNLENAQFANTITDKGWNVEFSIPWSAWAKSVKHGDTMFFSPKYNDDNGNVAWNPINEATHKIGTKREEVTGWGCSSSLDWKNPMGLATITLDSTAVGSAISKISDNYDTQDIIIYPNPAKTKVYIGGLVANQKVRMVNMLGAEVYCTNALSDKIEIDVINFKRGVYLINTGNNTKCIILQ